MADDDEIELHFIWHCECPECLDERERMEEEEGDESSFASMRALRKELGLLALVSVLQTEMIVVPLDQRDHV